jgi:hypothetical protein
MPPALRSVDFLRAALLSPSGDWEAGYASAEIVGNRLRCPVLLSVGRFRRRCVRRRDAEAPVRTDANVSVPVPSHGQQSLSCRGGLRAARGRICVHRVAIEVSAVAGIVCIEENGV